MITKKLMGTFQHTIYEQVWMGHLSTNFGIQVTPYESEEYNQRSIFIIGIYTVTYYYKMV